MSICRALKQKPDFDSIYVTKTVILFSHSYFVSIRGSKFSSFKVSPLVQNDIIFEQVRVSH